jgi:proteasome lid subunit RPN8/RPN11
VWQRLARHAAATLPEECCGLLIGHAHAVADAQPIANVAPERTRHYRLDAGELLHAIRAAEAAGREIVGIYHSHPVGDPIPSATDLADAWPVYQYLILAPTGDRWHARCWQLQGNDFQETQITPQPSAA